MDGEVVGRASKRPCRPNSRGSCWLFQIWLAQSIWSFGSLNEVGASSGVEPSDLSYFIPMAERQAIIHAYRQLYRHGLKAVNYSTPARHVLVQTLRSSFRTSPAQDFDSLRITNTLNFLHKAANVAGIEHKIVRNLLMIKFWDQPGRVRANLRPIRGLDVDQRDPKIRKDSLGQFKRTLMFLNESLGTCLR